MNYFKKASPFVFFFVLALLPALPALQGKILVETDNIQWKYSAQQSIDEHEKTGNNVLWNSSVFCGMPAYTIAPEVSQFSLPITIQTFVQSVGKPTYFYFLYLTGFFILLRTLLKDEWLAAIGSMAFAFASFNTIIIAAGHETQALSIAYMPVVLAGIVHIFRRRFLSGAAILSVSVALLLSNNHYQIVFYTLVIASTTWLYYFVQAIKSNDYRQFAIATLIALISACVGILPNITAITTTHEYAPYSIRGEDNEQNSEKITQREFAFNWSSGKIETFTSLIPELFGGSSFAAPSKAPEAASQITPDMQNVPLYWGAQPDLIGPVYFGATIWLLFVIGMITIKTHQKWWLLMLSFIGFALSWGRNFETLNYFLFDNIPFINKFRAVTMAKVIPQVIFPLVGFWGLQDLFETGIDVEKKKKIVLVAGISLIALCLTLGFAVPQILGTIHPNDKTLKVALSAALQNDRKHLALMSALRSAGFITVLTGALWLYLSGKIKKLLFFSALGCIIALDLIPISMDYLNETNFCDEVQFANLFAPRNADTEILKDHNSSNSRVFDITVAPLTSSRSSLYHKSLGGNSPAPLKTYNKLAMKYFYPTPNSEVLKMLNAKYIIVASPGRPSQSIPLSGALGNAWFVTHLKNLGSEQEVLDSMHAAPIGDTAKLPTPFFDAKNVALTAKTETHTLASRDYNNDSTSEIKMTHFTSDKIEYTSKNTSPGFAVFSEIYYPKGWVAKIDGKETEIHRVNYTLRGIEIPSGSHNIVFEFHPASFYNYTKFVNIGNFIIALLVVVAILAQFRIVPWLKNFDHKTL